MSKHLTFEMAYHDADLFEIRIVASNGDFSGATNVYTTPVELEALAAKLKNFPKTIDDRVNFDGNPVSEGQAQIQFFCATGTGHTAAAINIGSINNWGPRVKGRDQVYLLLNYFDRPLQHFAEQIIHMTLRRSGTATLKALD